MATTASLHELIGKYLDRATTDAEMAELTRRLRGDPDAADAFARACRRDVWLTKRLREQRNGEHFRATLEEAERSGTGIFRVREGGALRRGVVIEAGVEGAALALGGYCRIALDPNSVVRVSGSRRRESIVLERGRVVCEVARRPGRFTVETERCTISVQGTHSSVELLGDEGEQAMPGKQALVKVFAGAVLVAAAGAQGVVAAGEEKLVAGDLVMTAKDLPLEVGRRMTYTVANPAGEGRSATMSGCRLWAIALLASAGPACAGQAAQDAWAGGKPEPLPPAGVNVLTLPDAIAAMTRFLTFA